MVPVQLFIISPDRMNSRVLVNDHHQGIFFLFEPLFFFSFRMQMKKRFLTEELQTFSLA